MPATKWNGMVVKGEGRAPLSNLVRFEWAASVADEDAKIIQVILQTGSLSHEMEFILKTVQERHDIADSSGTYCMSNLEIGLHADYYCHLLRSAFAAGQSYLLIRQQCKTSGIEGSGGARRVPEQSQSVGQAEGGVYVTNGLPSPAAQVSARTSRSWLHETG
eukprot:scaffold435577_cov46-Prasinocladus_malaysianus.AAC.1